MKLSLYELLQQSKDHKEAMNQLLRIIELDINDLKSFVSFVGSVKISQNPTIAFYDQEVRSLNHS